MAMFEKAIDVFVVILGGLGGLLVAGALINLLSGLYNEDSAKIKSGWMGIAVGIGMILLGTFVIPMAKDSFAFTGYIFPQLSNLAHFLQ